MDPNFTDRMPQYESITTVSLANGTVTVTRKTDEFVNGPDAEVYDAITKVVRTDGHNFRKIAVEVSTLKGVSQVTFLDCYKNGMTFKYLY